MMPNPREHYNQRIQILESELTRLGKYFRLFYILRSLFFLSSIGFLAGYIKSDYQELYLWISGGLFIGFLTVVRWDLRFEKQQRFLKKQLLIQQNELKYLDHQYQAFDDGNTFSTLNPALSGDFDLFGAGSLFQYLNRCVTQVGQKKFAQGLSSWSLNPSAILDKQQAIDELSKKIDFTEAFRATGMLVDEKGREVENLSTWLSQPSEKTGLLKLITLIYPLTIAIWIVLIAFNMVSSSSIVAPLLAGFFFVLMHQKKLNRAHENLSRSAATFKKYAALIHLAEAETFDSPLLLKIQKNFATRGLSAGQSLSRLFKLLEQFDYRSNMIVSLVLNGLLLFDIRTYCKLAQWKTQHHELVPGWFETLFELDAFMSLAVFAFNNRATVFMPEPVASASFVFQATEMGHPLLPPEVRVNNSVSFEGQPQILVITGANMAGKSTFLRTLAVNLILALNGAPVCARQFRFTPCPIVSSINIRDSLSHHESYFYAELVRLKSIMEQAREHPGPLIFLDEILRGTNSKDKQTGSLGYLKKLMGQKACVVMATHDLVIGELEKQYPDVVSNYCFEVELENDHLVFDYQLKKGISKKLNASFLMHKMELTD
jgi:hypothetical protein